MPESRRTVVESVEVQLSLLSTEPPCRWGLDLLSPHSEQWRQQVQRQLGLVVGPYLGAQARCEIKREPSGTRIYIGEPFPTLSVQPFVDYLARALFGANVHLVETQPYRRALEAERAAQRAKEEGVA